MNILVTGGAGFIGSHTVERLLSTGAGKVTILDSFNDYYNPAIKRANVAAMGDRVTVAEGELTDRAFVDALFETGKFDAVIHLAARAGVRPSIAQPELYIDNLEIFRKQSLAAGIPFWNFFNIMPYGPHTDPTEAQVRWQVNASLVYGAKGLLYFCYFTPGGDEFPKGGAIIGQDGLKTHHYAQAKRINKMLQSYGKVLMDCTSTDVAQIMPGDTPSEKLRQSGIRDIKRDRVDPPHDYLVGTFRHKSGRRAVMLMNNRFAYSAWPTVEFDVRSGQRVVEIDPETGREVPLHDASPAMAGVQLPLMDGGARLFLVG